VVAANGSLLSADESRVTHATTAKRLQCESLISVGARDRLMVFLNLNNMSLTPSVDGSLYLAVPDFGDGEVEDGALLKN
jgi:hypothetical protein